MDKMREAFEAWLGYCEQLDRHTIESMWSAWQAATAQCVPEGYVTRESAIAAINHLGRSNGLGRFNEAIMMLEAAPKPGEQA